MHPSFQIIKEPLAREYLLLPPGGDAPRSKSLIQRLPGEQSHNNSQLS